MREIIFRGKDKTNNKWVVGSGIIVDTNSTIIYRKNIEGLYFENVIPETVGQYTGLTDKNGTKIFEGDIIQRPPKHKIDKTHTYKVIFLEGSFEYADLNEEYPYSFDDSEFGIFSHHYEVIGNIHDNPELLGGAE